MNTKTLFFILIAAAFVLLSTAAISGSDIRDHAWSCATADIDGARYDITLERMFEGTVESEGRVIEGLMYFPLKTGDNMMEVQIGPKEFVDRSGFKLRVGEWVTVVGMPTILAGRKVLLAREVRSMTTVFIVRDRNGEPIWDPNRPIQMDTEFPVICEMFEP